MEIRDFDKEKDYETLCKWWDDWGMPKYIPEAISDTGIIISKDGVDICSAFIFSTDSYTCWIEYLTMNKNTTKEQRKGVLRRMFDALLERSTKMGFRLIMTFATEDQERKSPMLTKLKKEYFEIVTKNMTQYYRVIN
jgi:hypothetical protein